MTSRRNTPFTSEIFAELVLRLSNGPGMVAWAEAMLIAGFESQHLNVLVGETPPFNDFEMDEMLERTRRELNVPRITSTEQAVEIIVTCCIKKHVEGWVSQSLTLSAISTFAFGDDLPTGVFDFYLLACAVDDLAHAGVSYHWQGADQSNIDQIIQGKFENWLDAHPLSEWQAFEWFGKQQFTCS